MVSRIVRSISLTVVLVLSACSARADLVNGDPSSDAAWTLAANSTVLGDYVRGSGLFEYEVYLTSYTLTAGSPLVGGNWNVGDTILGIGGRITNAAAVNLTQSVRVVAKFGTDPTSWSPSTTLTPPGNGQGSTSAGNGGIGGTLIGTANPDSAGQFILPVNAGLIHILPISTVYLPPETTISSPDYGKLIFTVTTPANPSEGELNTWSMYLNTSRLATVRGVSFADESIPKATDRMILTLQRSNNATLFTDTLAAVPEASPAVLLSLVGSLACVATWYGRNRNRA